MLPFIYLYQCFWMIHYFASASTIVDVLVSKQFLTMNQSMTEQWYGKNGTCLLFPPTQQSFQERMQTCNIDSLETLSFGGTLTPFSFQRDNQPYGHCCISDMSLHERGFVDVIEGYEDPNRLTLYRLLNYLLETKRGALVFIGK